MIICPICNKPFENDENFCKNCGASLLKEIAPVQNADNTLTIKSFKLPKNIIMLCSSGIAIILIVVLLLWVVFGIFVDKDYAVYVKDGEIYYTKLRNIKSKQVTEHLVEDDWRENYSVTSGLCVADTVLTKDGRFLFYMEKIDNSDTGNELFCRYVNNFKKTPIKIDSDVLSFTVNETGELVTYIKGNKQDIYQYNFENKEKLGSNIEYYNMSPDGKIIVYSDENKNLYIKKEKRDVQKVADSITTVNFVSDDCSKIYYTKDKTLYKIENEKEIKIASNVSGIAEIYDSGEIYYCENVTEQLYAIDYVEDDCAEIDAKLTNPEKPEVPLPSEFDNQKDYQKAIEKYSEEYIEYEEKSSEYRKKVARDELREDLKVLVADVPTKILYYYDGEKTKVVSENHYVTESTAKGKSVIVFSVCDKSSIKKVKLSQIVTASEVSSFIRESIKNLTKVYIATGDELKEIEQNDADCFDISDNGEIVYFIDNRSEDDYSSDLYKITLSNEELKLFDTNVYGLQTSNYFSDEGQYIYLKNVKEHSVGTLCVDGVTIEENVHRWYSHYEENLNWYFYMTDWDKEKEIGDLNILCDGEKKKIAENVHEYRLTEDNKILYLADYDSEKIYGKLYYYKNGKSKLVDKKVVSIASIYYKKTYGGGYSFG